MNLSKISLLALFFAFTFVFTSCDPDDPEPVNEQEVITTLTYTLTPQGGGSPVILSFRDLDGDGGSTPVITGGTFAANTTYTGAIVLLNETETPVENVTEEIEEEDDEHQFFFQASGANVTVAYADTDGTNPVGLVTTVTTGDASSGNLTVILRHEPNKDGAGVSDGDIANAGGETDIEVTFNVTVE